MSEKVSLNQLPTAQPSQEFVVPTELVPLPSLGLVYPPDSPLHNQPTIEIRSMTAREEDILTSRALLKSGKVISVLLRSCIVNQHVDPEKMLVGDRNAALIAIRITGYGPEYKIQVQCPGCGEKTVHSVDLSRLPIKRMPESVKPVRSGENLFEYTLPVWKKKVLFKILTGADESELMTIIERGRKAGIQEELVTTRLKSQIVAIDGEQDKARLAMMIRNMPARDSRELRKYIDEATPNVELVSNFTCPLCDFQTEEVEVPLGTEFFWPQA